MGGAIGFDEVFGYGHLIDSARECCKGVRWKSSTQLFESQIIAWTASLHRDLMAGTYKSRGFSRFTIHERGKVRNIQSVHISERAVQKCLVQHCLRPLVVPKLIYDNCATLPGRGVEFALGRLREHLRWWHARHGREGSVLVMDYSDYFASIRHDMLLGMYAQLPMDGRLLTLTRHFVECFESDRGLGLGSEISQVSAVFYVNGIDHMLKDGMGFHCYGRYMDDSYLIGERRDVERALSAVEAESAALGLRLNPKATRILPLDHAFRYLKKRVRLTETGGVEMKIDGRNAARRRRQLKKMAEKLAGGKCTMDEIRQSQQSWRAHAGRYGSREMVRSMDALYTGLFGEPP